MTNRWGVGHPDGTGGTTDMANWVGRAQLELTTMATGMEKKTTTKVTITRKTQARKTVMNTKMIRSTRLITYPVRTGASGSVTGLRRANHCSGGLLR
jgi:hypothetical protein